MLRIGHYETCKLLIEYTPCGNNLINEIDGEGQTPLHAAAEQGHVKVVKMLLRRGAAAVRLVQSSALQLFFNQREFLHEC